MQSHFPKINSYMRMNRLRNKFSTFKDFACQGVFKKVMKKKVCVFRGKGIEPFFGCCPEPEKRKCWEDWK